jgi:hypothetical protein
VVLTPAEVGQVLGFLRGTHRLIGLLLYGGGLRLAECLALRVKDVDLERRELLVRRGKAGKDRVTVLAESAREALVDQLRRVKLLHERDMAEGRGWVELPGGLNAKYPAAARSWPWQWVFPARRTYRDREMGAGAAPSSARVGDPAGDGGGSPGERDRQAGELSHSAALVRDPPAAGRLRYPDGAGVCWVTATWLRRWCTRMC